MLTDMTSTQNDTSKLSNPRNKKNWVKKGLVGALLLSIAGGGYYFFEQNKAGHEKEEISKNLIAVKRGRAKIYVLATGLIKPIQEVKISPKQTGLLKTLLVKQGDRVKEGQLIAVMDDSNLLGDAAAARGAYLAALDNVSKLESGNRPQEVSQARYQELKAKNAARQAKENIQRLEAQVEALTIQLSRNETFAKRQTYLAQEGAVSDQAGIDADTQAEVTKSQLRAAKQEKEQAEAALAQSLAEMNAIAEQHALMRAGYRKEDIEAARHSAMQAKGQLMRVESLINDTRIKAPFAGVITQKYTDAGAIVTPTTSAATTSATSSSIVALAGSLEMVAQVSESNLPKIKLGQPVEITATAYPDKIFRGKVTQIAPAAIVTSNVTTFEVHAEPLDKDSQLLAGMNVSAKFIVGELDDAITVPTVCVISRKGQSGVFMPDAKGEPEFKPVKTGPTTGRDIVITEGLKDGDKIFQGLSREQLAKEGYGGRQQPGQGSGPGASAMRMGGAGRMTRGFGN